jgi:nucleoside-diphosphate-sugar epimerase
MTHVIFGVRAEVAATMLAAHRAGRAEVAIVRGSDFIGPAVTGAVLGAGAIRPALSGKAAQLVGKPDLPHTVTYIGDTGRAIAAVALRDDAYGQVWHAPNAPGMSQRTMMDLVFAEVGRARVAGGGAPDSLTQALADFQHPLLFATKMANIHANS